MVAVAVQRSMPNACSPGQTVGRCVTVIVTRDRPALLAQCLIAVLGQSLRPDQVIVVDNASGPETRDLLTMHSGVRTLRLPQNAGGAGGFHAGIELALQDGAEWLWLMDDDGRPHDAGYVRSFVRTAVSHRAEMVGALIIDVDDPERLSFPVRIAGRTRFDAAEIVTHGPVSGLPPCTATAARRGCSPPPSGISARSPAATGLGCSTAMPCPACRARTTISSSCSAHSAITSDARAGAERPLLQPCGAARFD